MLVSFVVLVRPVGAANLSLHAAAAPDALMAIAAVTQSLRDNGRREDVVVGVFRREDWNTMGGLFDRLDDAVQSQPAASERR